MSSFSKYQWTIQAVQIPDWPHQERVKGLDGHSLIISVKSGHGFEIGCTAGEARIRELIAHLTKTDFELRPLHDWEREDTNKAPLVVTFHKKRHAAELWLLLHYGVNWLGNRWSDEVCHRFGLEPSQ